MRFYLAAPFFNEEQRSTLEKIERCAKEVGISLYSPRIECYCPPNATPAQRKETFDKNHQNVLTCDFILARIDDFDAGTMWEMGFAYAVRTPTYAFTTVKERGLNLMLAESCNGFLQGLTEVFEFLNEANKNNFRRARKWVKPII